MSGRAALAAWALGAWALGAWALGACARPGAGAPLPPDFVTLDGMALAPPLLQGDWLLGGRFELTRGEYRNDVPAAERDLPAVMLSLEEAEDWGRPRGLRVPTIGEWRHLAGWGSTSGGTPVARASRNSLELGLHEALPVGVFERGRTALGAYDVHGNVWEWVRDPRASGDAAMGGSFASRAVGRSDDRIVHVAGTRAADVGVRLVADATAFFLERAVPAWQALDAGGRARAARVFLRWRPDLRRSFADRLAAEGAPEGLCGALREARYPASDGDAESE